MSLSDFPRYPLTFGPSPIHPLKRLSEHLGGAAIWAKREDCNSGLAFGGNKTRKLEYLVPDALAQGATHLVTIGGVQSNHTRQVAAVAASLGLGAKLVQESWVDWPDAVNDRVGNILLSRIMGADVELVDAGFGIAFTDLQSKESWENALEEIRAAGGTPYAIPAGASDHPLGGLGFANWADEVRRQEEQLGVFFDTVVVCSVTGSTHAGMIAGFAGQDRPRRVLGIDASAKIDETRAQVEKIARATAATIGLGRELRDDEITVLEGWAGEYYGIPVQSTLDAIRLTGRLEGVILDPVYEGKSMAALIDLVRSNDIPRTSNVLYAHLGGQLALNAYSALFKS
ncbi:1-aminocyclopropane-1-carboxylate deaminase [Kribbella sp. CA-294648]|uniref:1-aminocyclopropane-1-carboxylate deaminase n=1 Tax=Kribbella sp. CA-294648 TaxID=3239948 RepID=UPI003D8CC309